MAWPQYDPRYIISTEFHPPNNGRCFIFCKGKTALFEVENEQRIFEGRKKKTVSVMLLKFCIMALLIFIDFIYHGEADLATLSLSVSYVS